RKSSSPLGRAMKPSTLAPTKTEAVVIGLASNPSKRTGLGRSRLAVAPRGGKRAPLDPPGMDLGHQAARLHRGIRPRPRRRFLEGAHLEDAHAAGVAVVAQWPGRDELHRRLPRADLGAV